MVHACGPSPASHPGMGSGSPALSTLSTSPRGSAALEMEVPRISMRRRVVEIASSSVRHALRPVLRRGKRIWSFPNGAYALGAGPPPSPSAFLISLGVWMPASRSHLARTSHGLVSMPRTWST
eukprot:4669170-Pyramimonas_sp.AAC.1